MMATDGGAGGVDAESEDAGELVRETACWRRAASRSAQVTSRTTATDGGADEIGERARRGRVQGLEAGLRCRKLVAGVEAEEVTGPCPMVGAVAGDEQGFVDEENGGAERGEHVGWIGKWMEGSP